MKKLLIIIAVLFIAAPMFLPQVLNAQAPEKMSYQAVIRDANNLLVTYTEVGILLSILQESETGTPVYEETQLTMTNANGLVTFKIGAGTVVSGDFTLIDWSDGPYFVQTEIDLQGGTNYTIAVTTQLLSVPFSLHAKTADSLTGTITETDPLFNAAPAAIITYNDINFWNSKLDEEIDGDTTNEIQFLSLQSDTLLISDAGFVVLPAESDPIFDTSVAGGITAADTTNWGNHIDSTDIANMG
jgi:hypothetical protein